MNFFSLISLGDFVDLYFKLRQKGLSFLWSKFAWSKKNRTFSKWNAISPGSDFWIIPAVRERWNEKCTGYADLEFEDYVFSKYFAHRQNLRMLSIGCGTGSKERKFAQYPNFTRIEGVDLATSQICEAKALAQAANLHHIEYLNVDFSEHAFDGEAYDLILFNSSLHHFDHVTDFLKNKVKPLLHPDGLLVVFEYVGPNRLQWKPEQLKVVNHLLKEMPSKYKGRFQSTFYKNRVYRPGLLRMLAIDPSEAIDSESIIPALHAHFSVIEEKDLGWDVLHLLLKDISHNFLGNDKQTKELLDYLFEQEDMYTTTFKCSDAKFGIYGKRVGER